MFVAQLSKYGAKEHLNIRKICTNMHWEIALTHKCQIILLEKRFTNGMGATYWQCILLCVEKWQEMTQLVVTIV